ncbi:hypothetical protein [Amycolatopsis mediterranei]|uniref:hypothetical protein n=1 Tax=Amycolatopsis mediterranei TaxID=33910 RepID=UPI00049FD8CF|nr:hypothetical protein [Amycolatopsis mediterranei]KDO11003.1 hypothetical protein DV26_10780 [Amycolatopsis mediterranei]KDU86886.1 hypothetical protein DV36_39690 [Amycolatopsis mediterranei]UZF73475.1 hypothetical protein ISP_006918 [Amycolatopsis mediterranei]
MAIAGAGTGTAAGTDRTGLPPGPAILEDRRAHKLWFQFDAIALYHFSQEFRTPTPSSSPHPANAPEGLYEKWRELSRDPAYPKNYAEFVEPIEGPPTTLSKLQLDNFDHFYRGDEAGLVKAFAAFGQGILFDPRRAPEESEVHTMNGNPPSGYHFWHSVVCAQLVQGIDRHRWARIDPMTGFGWPLQSIVKPDHRHVNPALPRDQVRSLPRYWLQRSPAELDQDFRPAPCLA